MRRTPEVFYSRADATVRSLGRGARSTAPTAVAYKAPPSPPSEIPRTNPPCSHRGACSRIQLDTLEGALESLASEQAFFLRLQNPRAPFASSTIAISAPLFHAFSRSRALNRPCRVREPPSFGTRTDLRPEGTTRRTSRRDEITRYERNARAVRSIRSYSDVPDNYLSSRCLNSSGRENRPRSISLLSRASGRLLKRIQSDARGSNARRA